MRPLALKNFKRIDGELAGILGRFWAHIWNGSDPKLDPRTRLLLSLSNAVGARRFRQATRELVKAYALGVTTGELDELFSLFIWNQGVGTFASEIGPSPLFRAYLFIKEMEKKGLQREQAVKNLVEKFGEGNPDVGTLPEV